MADACKQLGENVLNVLKDLKDNKQDRNVLDATLNQLKMVTSLADTINTTLQGSTPENLSDLLESEMHAMDKAIEEAANNIQVPILTTFFSLHNIHLRLINLQDLLNKSRVANSGIQLEVNEKLLDSCTNLMQAITILIKKSRLLQAEIVAQGKVFKS